MLALRRTALSGVHASIRTAAGTKAVTPSKSASPVFVRPARVRHFRPAAVMCSAQDGRANENISKKEPPFLLASDDDKFKIKYKSGCLCGAVEYAVDSDPIGSKFCHCTSCQRLHGAPFQWAAIFPKDKVRFIKGVENLGFLNTQDKTPKHELPCKVSCTICHSPIASEGRNMWMAFPTLFDFEDRKIPKAFQPDAHIFYAERCMDVNDGMPKWSAHKDDSEELKEERKSHNIS